MDVHSVERSIVIIEKQSNMDVHIVEKNKHFLTWAILLILDILDILDCPEVLETRRYVCNSVNKAGQLLVDLAAATSMAH